MTPKPTEPAAEANQCARAIVSLVETKTGKSLDMSDCVRIVQCVGLAIESQLAAQSAQIEELNKDRRTKREAIKCWQRHSAEVATELGCLSTTDAIIDRVKHIKAQIEAASATATLHEATLNIATNEINFLRRRESAADQAMLETLPDYDAANEPLANAIMRVKEQIEAAKEAVAALGLVDHECVSVTDGITGDTVLECVSDPLPCDIVQVVHKALSRCAAAGIKTEE